MTPEQLAYIEQRRRQIRYWPWMAIVLVALLLAAYAWLWQNAPINLNPQLVLQQFHVRVISDEEMILLAARGTLALIGCGLLVLVLVLLISLALWNERRLILMIDALRAASGASPAAPAAGAGTADPDAPAAAGTADAALPGPAATGVATPDEAASAEAAADTGDTVAPDPVMPERHG